MLESIDRHAPDHPRHRFALAVVLAVTAVLAFGDAFGFITFPVYQLGLPDAAWADFAVFVFGVLLAAVTYRLVQTAVEGSTFGVPGGTPTATADGAGQYDDRDPVHIVKARYARGELDDEEYETMLSRLDGYEDSDADEYTSARDFAENYGLDDRQTVID